jgi:hypothetical protein
MYMLALQLGISMIDYYVLDMVPAKCTRVRVPSHHKTLLYGSKAVAVAMSQRLLSLLCLLRYVYVYAIYEKHGSQGACAGFALKLQTVN